MAGVNLTLPPAATLALWLLAVSSRAGIASAAGSGAAWYVEEYEYSFVEVLILISLVSLGLVFEAVSHLLLHRVEGSYKFGDLHEIVDTATGNHHAGLHHKVPHVQLHKELLIRSGGEFMTLGWIAFCIFFFRECSGFKQLVSAISPSASFRLPESEGEWLHMAEMVHMKLFFGMVFYLVLISRVVNGSVEKIRLWERMRLHRVGHPTYDASTMRPSNALQADLTEYVNWRRYFISKMVKLQSRRPAVFNEILARLSIDAAAPDASQRFQAVLDSDFCFGEYLSHNIANGVRDSIEVHMTTWLALLFLFGSFALLHRFAQISLISMVPPSIAIVVLSLVAMQFHVSRTRSKITMKMQHLEMAAEASSSSNAERATSSNPATGLRFNERWQTELLFLRVLQVLLFLISYGFSRTLLDFHDWAEYPETSLLFTSCFTLLFTALAYHLPAVVPIFLGIMAMPPCLDDDNFAIFYDVLVLGRACSEHEGGIKSKAPPPIDEEAVVAVVAEAKVEEGGKVIHKHPVHVKQFIEYGFEDVVDFVENYGKKTSKDAGANQLVAEAVRIQSEGETKAEDPSRCGQCPETGWSRKVTGSSTQCPATLEATPSNGTCSSL